MAKIVHFSIAKFCVLKLILKAIKRQGKIAISNKNYINIMRSITSVTYLLRGSQGYCEKKEGD